MEFGKVDKNQVARINYTLPPDSAFTKKILRLSAKSTVPLIYAGCAKWGRKDWIGTIYPTGTKEKDFLELYVQHFNSIELNATHYKIYGPEVIRKWAEKAEGTNFIFCPKMAKSITQYSNLATPDVKDKTDKFIKGIRAFSDHLGPVFIQLNEKFSPGKKENLYKFLTLLPKDIQFFLELRNEQWFADKKIRSEWLNTLSSLSIGAVITDASGRRDAVHMELTVPKAFIRFVGNGLHKTDYTRIDEWADRIKLWLDKGVKEVYFFMHQDEEKNSPVLCDYAIGQFNKRCGTDLKRVQFVKSRQK